MRVDVDSLLDGMAGIAYLGDRTGRISTLGRQNWNAFAAANNGDHLIDGGPILGRSLFDVIAGDEVRGIYARCFTALFDERLDGLRLLTRCDSPAVRRELWVTMRPVLHRLDVEAVLVQVLVVSEQLRPPIDLFDFRAVRERAARDAALPVLGMCSQCQQVRGPAGSGDADGEWTTAEEYYRRGGDARVRISHGLCPLCFEHALAMLPN